MEGMMKAGLGSLVLMLAVIVSVLGTICDAQDTGMKLRICNNNAMSNRDLQLAWAQATSEVLDHTADVGHHKAERTVESQMVWSIGACNARLDQGACTRCVGTAMTLLAEECYSGGCGPSIGAQITLVDCRLRWETYDFDW